MKVILAVDRNFAIGINGDMLFSIPEDMQRFKDLTTGNIIVMGRKTLESFPDSKPLENRINVVLTRSDIEGVYSVKSREELLNKLEELNPNKEMEEYLIGGANTIENMFDLVDECIITYVDSEFEYDTKIHNLFEDKNFYITDKSEIYHYENLSYQYIIFKRN